MGDRKVERYIQYRSSSKRYRARVPDGHGKRLIGSWRETLGEARVDREQLLTEKLARETLESAEPEQPNTTEGARFEVDGNTATARSVGLIHTLPKLLETCEVDTAVWEVLKWGVKPYPGWAKHERADIKWKNGAIVDGYVRKSGIEVVQLYSMHATFVRKEPIFLFPTVQPIETTATYKEPPPARTDGIGTALVWCDSQIGYAKDARTAHLEPFHSRQALDILVQIAHYLQPDRIDGLGDTLDLAEWSDRFTRRPEFYQTTQPALLEAHWWLAQLREAVPLAHIRLYEGNHEARIERALNNSLQAALDLRPADEIELPPPLHPRRLLGLDALQIEWIGDYPDGCDWLNDHIQLSHGNIAVAETARRIVNRSMFCQVYGHTHRREVFGKVIDARHGQAVVQAVNPGCMCRTDYVVPGHKRGQNWHKGLAIIRFEANGPALPEVVLVGIENGRALYDGCVFEARDRVQDIATDIPQWNWV